MSGPTNGSEIWKKIESDVESLDCEKCKKGVLGRDFVKFWEDSVNVKIGKPLKNPENFNRIKKIFSKTPKQMKKTLEKEDASASCKFNVCDSTYTRESTDLNIYDREIALYGSKSNIHIDNMAHTKLKLVGSGIASLLVGRGFKEVENAFNVFSKPVVAGLTVKNLLNVFGGLGLSFAGAYLKKFPDKLRVPSVFVGSYLFVEEAVDLSKAALSLPVKTQSVSIEAVNPKLGPGLVQVDV